MWRRKGHRTSHLNEINDQLQPLQQQQLRSTEGVPLTPRGPPEGSRTPTAATAVPQTPPIQHYPQTPAIQQDDSIRAPTTPLPTTTQPPQHNEVPPLPEQTIEINDGDDDDDDDDGDDDDDDDAGGDDDDDDAAADAEPRASNPPTGSSPTGGPAGQQATAPTTGEAQPPHPQDQQVQITTTCSSSTTNGRHTNKQQHTPVSRQEPLNDADELWKTTVENQKAKTPKPVTPAEPSSSPTAPELGLGMTMALSATEEPIQMGRSGVLL